MTTLLHRLLLIVTFTMSGLLGPSVLAGDKPAILVYSSGVDGILADDLDAGLRQAVLALEENGLFLGNPGEANEVGVNLFFKILMSRMHLQVDFGPVPGAPQGSPPVSGQLTVHGNSGASVEQLLKAYRHLATLNKDFGKPVPDHPGLYQLNVQKSGPPVYAGEWQVDGKPAFMVSANRLPKEEEPDFSGFGLPPEATVNLGLQLNFSSLGPLLDMAMAMDPQAAQGTAILEVLGLTGPDAMDLSIACGSTRDGSVVIGGHLTNFMKHYGGLIPAQGLAQEDLRTLPKDASAFDIQKFNLRGIPAFIDNLIVRATPPDQLPMGPDGKPVSPMDMGMQMARMLLGIDLKTQFFDYLGDTVAIYRADSTGGGGLFSLTGLVKLDNPEGMQQSLATIAANLDGQLSRLSMFGSQNHVRFVDWSSDSGLQMITIAFPEFPVPVQLTCAVVGSYLVLGMAPESVMSAARHMGSGVSILDNATFKSSKAFSSDHIQRMQYMDTGARLSDGYGLTAGIMTALGNYARPRKNAPDRIDSVMPGYDQMAESVRPAVLLQVIDGDTLSFKGSGHRSVVSHMTAFMGELTSSPFITTAIIGGVAGLIVPAIVNAREAAQAAEASANLRRLYMAVVQYSVAHNGHLPKDLKSLPQPGGYPEDLIHRAAYYPDTRKLDDIPNPHERMLLSQHIGNNKVIIAFAEGHIRTVSDREWQLLVDAQDHNHDHDHDHDHHDHP
ncbi:MAG: hypothetical protein VX527_06555 [Planctomycetota bacterium]|nr:hypothetical protein [Planctomycetota bacterium]